MLPADAWKKCNERLTVSVTPWSASKIGQPPVRIKSFKSNEDLIEACLCSSHLPFYMDNRAYREWRGERWIDGGLFHDIIPQCPETVDPSTIIMSCPVELLTRSRTDRDRIICPDPEQLGLSDMLKWFAIPPLKEDLEQIQSIGRQNAEDWLAKQAIN